MAAKKGGLGRGLDSLFSENATDDNIAIELRLSEIEPNKDQPRVHFDEEALQELADSIEKHGLLQPLVVRPQLGGTYQIVAGERRWRASRLAGLTEVPVRVIEADDRRTAELALVENLQREDLNPIEEALGYQSLINDFNLTQEAVSEKLGKSRSAIANSLRLLSLEDEIKKYLISGEISSGHARAILSLEDKNLRIELAERILLNGLNVRQAEALSKTIQRKKPKKEKPVTVYDIELKSLCERLSSRFGTKVSLTQGKNKNKIEIEYYNDSDLERILELLDKNI